MKRGFTLIELLVVMAVIGLLASLSSPFVRSAIEKGNATKCLANLRAMAQAVNLYAADHQGQFPPALISEGGIQKGWDFFISGNGSSQMVEPGWIWEGYGVNAILQCPSYRGSDNWRGEPYTGYNYNASYLGGMEMTLRGRAMRDVPSSTVLQVRNPAATALFGDGGYAGGANKFMRSPNPGKLDPDFIGREGGTQDYRHDGATHVVFVDGHVSRRWPVRAPAHVAPGTGFLSEDNSLYDLE